ncbi:MAG: ParA family protein [Calditrichaeota bacterium]|nr:MAG: ParA family protein [Calditrichota bacterium]MBL1206691.1 ParA family protein [Calditrichota bacterium]NOG46518.1 ParA family protein [Calditrichota bacterium]
MGKIIAITNQKGGVGKTTTAINLASCIAIAERSTLLIDMDPQANATSGVGVNPEDNEVTSYEVLVGDQDASNATMKTVVPNLDLIPSHIRLVGAEVELVSKSGREYKLKHSLAELKEKYDYIFIDCPPSLSLLTLNALTAADSVLIPIQCEYYALEGLSQLLNTVHLVQKNLNKSLQIEGVVLTMYDNRLNLCNQVAHEVRDYFKEKVYKTAISRNVRLGEAPSFGKPVIMYDAVCIGSQNYMNLAEEVLGEKNK